MMRQVYDDHKIYTHSIAVGPFDSWPVNSTEATLPQLQAGECAVFNGVFFEVSSTRLLDIAKAQLKARLAEHRWRLESGGITFNGTGIQTDDSSVLRIEMLKSIVEDDPTKIIDFKAGDGSNVQADAAMALALWRAVTEFGQKCRSREPTLSAQIDAAMTLADLEAVDIYSGWPDNVITI